VDAEQLARIQKFFAEFRTEGAHSGIYQRYDTVEEFAEFAYDHIAASIKEAAKVSTLKNEIEKKIGPIATDTTAMRELVLEAIEELERLYDQPDSIVLPSGFAEFDQITGGLHGSEMIVIAGPPGIGKSALAMNIAGHVAIDLGEPVAFFTL
jgi:replicative DNA helicase